MSNLRGRRHGSHFLQVCLVLALLFLGMRGTGYARVSQVTTLTRVELNNTRGFVRLKFHFKGRVPRHPKAVLHGRVLNLFFEGVRKKGVRPPVVKQGGLIKAIHLWRGAKGTRVRILLSCKRVDYVRYQRRFPPLVVVCLRRSRKPRGTSPGESPRIQRLQTSRHKKKTEKGKTSRSRTRPVASLKGKKFPSPSTVPTWVPAKETHRKRHKKAEKVVPKANQPSPPISPPEAKTRFAEAHEAWETGHSVLSGRMFQGIVRSFPGTKEAEASAFYWVRSELQSSRGKRRNRERIANDYETILKRYPNASWTLMALRDLGTLYVRLGRYDRAITTYRRIIKEAPTSFEAENAYVSIGKIQLETRSFRDAEATLRVDLARFPKGKEAREAAFYLGDALYYQGQILQAIRDYQRAMGCRFSFASTDLKSLVKLADLFEKRGDEDRALGLLFLALNLSTHARERRDLLGRIEAFYRRMGRVWEGTTLHSIAKNSFVGVPLGSPQRERCPGK